MNLEKLVFFISAVFLTIQKWNSKCFQEKEVPAQCTAFVQYRVEIWSSIVCVENQQEMSMSYLGKALTEHDLQNWVFLRWKCYFYSCIFTNQNLHEGISHSIFCREESRNTIHLWKLRYLRSVQPTASCYPKQKRYTCQMMQGIQATANWLSHSNCLDIFTSLLQV